MKKEYVKPQNRVVVLKGNLLDGEIISGGHAGDGDEGDAKIHFDDDTSEHDVWED